MAIANGMTPACELPLTAVSVPSVPTVYAVMVPGLGNVQAGLFGGMAELLLTMNSAVPEGAKIMAAGVLPAATAFSIRGQRARGQIDAVSRDGRISLGGNKHGARARR